MTVVLGPTWAYEQLDKLVTLQWSGLWDVISLQTLRCSGLVVEYRSRNREVAGSTHNRSTASNLEQAANLLCA